jgi:hypothetical protein
MLVSITGLTSNLMAQDADQRARDLIASLDKTKFKKKHKANVSIQMYIDIENEAVVKDPSSATAAGHASEYGQSWTSSY